MTKTNRLRCPRCGVCYEAEAFATHIQEITCENCGNTASLHEEDPEGYLSGALPPLPRLIALAGAILLAMLSVRYQFFAVLLFGVLVYLAIDVFQGHRKQRADRIALWDRLKICYAELDRVIHGLRAELSESKQTYFELHNRYELISPERRDQLATEIISQKNTLDALGDLATITTKKQERMNEVHKLSQEKVTLERLVLERQNSLGVLGDIAALDVEKQKLQETIKELKKRTLSYENDELLQSFGFYKPMYDCVDSTAYKRLLEKARDEQKQMVKDGEAIRHDAGISVENDKGNCKKLVKNLDKLMLRAFNSECDAIIDKVKFSNLDLINARISKAFQELNDLYEPLRAGITQAYLDLKIKELHVCLEYQIKIKEEQEEQRKIRYEMKEQAKLEKEIEEAKKKIEKEEDHFHKVIDELRLRMESAASAQKTQYEAKLREYEEKLTAVQKDKEEVEFRAQSTRAGYVYVISNLGSFGDSVFKIGVTRRLDPEERVTELGDASVPFKFDIHAMIFSEDAPALEGALHEHFADRAINKVNPRKEFFRVSLDEIEHIVRTHHNKVVEFKKIAKAEDYRVSLAMVRDGAICNPIQGAN